MKYFISIIIGLFLSGTVMAAGLEPSSPVTKQGSASLEPISPKAKASTSSQQKMDAAGKKVQGMKTNFDKASNSVCGKGKLVGYNGSKPICGVATPVQTN
ncbi:MAG: hypothetical protein P1U34_05615 [Coxiellaceae bacterium]|nr:hypothetical protein [Coxiellaceae bacterium]